MSKATLPMTSVKRYLLRTFCTLCACGTQDDNYNDRTGNLEDGSANGSNVRINNGDREKTQRQGDASENFKKFDKEKRNKVIFWCHFAVFLLAAGACAASFTFPSLRKSRPRGIAMWQWSLLIAVLLGGPLISKAIVWFVLLFLGRKFKVKENLIYYVIGLVESAWVVLWFSMILIAWLMAANEPRYLGMPQNNQDEKVIQKFAATFPIINVTLITLILGSFIWLLKDLMLMITKSSFHIRRFFSRIRETLMHQYVITQLSSATEEVFNEGAGKKMIRSLTIDDETCLEGVKEEEVSCWGMKILIQSLIRDRPLTYKNGGSKLSINTMDDAIGAAKSIFESLGRNTGPHFSIRKTDLEKHFPGKGDEMMKILLQGVNAEEVREENFKDWMVNAFVYREALVRALAGNKIVFRRLNRFINVLIMLCISALWLIMLKDKTRKIIFVIGSAIVGAAFIFGDTSKKLLESFLFVFWMHPFDIGDCCLVNNQLVTIEEINVLTTIVSTSDNELHYPNSVMVGLPINNYTRCRHLNDCLEFYLHIDTPAKKIDDLKKEIQRYIKEGPRYWHDDHYWVIELEDMSTMKIILYVQHPTTAITYLQFRERRARKSDLVLKIKEIIAMKILHTL